MEIHNRIGRRKTAVVRVYLQNGKGTIQINDIDIDKYFKSDIQSIIVKQPLVLLNKALSYDIKANVSGGGVKGQAEAIRLGISRALVEDNAEHREILKKEGLLTRDSRMVERKKYGRRKARKKFQFSKR